ncbi:MAG: alpha/beta fold hydrolase [Lachnospiraceae bacterium]|nr:alpha/beta fold hydrolase [Lachnospiraceae bacterium]
MSNMKVKKTRFTCLRDGLAIRGFEFRPEGERLPAVILSHGFMSNHVDTDRYAKRFAEMGYAAYTFDFNGGCLIGSSDGKSTEMSVLTEEEDLKAVIAYVSALRYTDNSKLTLMGFSQGGFVSALAAADMPQRIKRLILYYPALCIPDDARAGQMMKASFDPENIPETFSCGPMKLGRKYAADVISMNPFEEIRGYRGPVLIVHGTADPIVNVAYAKQAWKTYTFGDINSRIEKEDLDRKGERCDLPEIPGHKKPHRYVQLALIAGGGHGFRGKKAEEAFERVRRFLDGWAEILTLDLRSAALEGAKKDKKERRLAGEAKSPFFRGEVTDCYVSRKDRWGKNRAAELVCAGKDYTGAVCEIRASYEGDGRDSALRVWTDSKALAYLKDSRCEASWEKKKEQMTVRVYSRRHDGE